MEYLVSFPRLEVLILREGRDDLDDEGVKQQAVLPSCRQCPLLERVISHRGDQIPNYTTFTIMRSNDSTQMEVTTHQDQYENDTSSSWWTRYVFLAY